MPLPPFTPMSPLLTDQLPNSQDWIYQLKWDGYRTIAWVDNGQVELYSKRMNLMNDKFPELVKALAKLSGSFVLDGEIVILDQETKRPSFQKLQQRGRLRESRKISKLSEIEPVQYILFDLLSLNGTNVRGWTLSRRLEALKQLVSDWTDPFYLINTFNNGPILWDWVVEHSWEGVVCKRLDSIYREGKNHKDWLKRKTLFRVEAEAVGLLYKEGRLSSFVMRKDGQYLGRVSSGLNGKIKTVLAKLDMDDNSERYFNQLPADLRGLDIKWLRVPILLELSGREITEGGALRHPKLLAIGGHPI